MFPVSVKVPEYLGKGWEPQGTSIGGRPCDVSVSWRVMSGRKLPHLVVAFGAGMTRKMGMKKGDRVQVFVNQDNHRVFIRIAPPDCPKTMSKGPQWRGFNAAVPVMLPGVKLTESKPAQEVPFEERDGGVYVVIPEWARVHKFIPVAGPLARNG